MIDVAAIDRTLAAALPAGALYAVGGRVRDEVRAAVEAVPPTLKDLDYVVLGLSADDLIRALRTIGRADVVGASFAVVKCTIGAVTVDVALPRRERSTGRGHRDFVVEFGPHVPLAEDLARRDFRMNMLARALPAGDVIDPYGGAADIAARLIRILRPSAFFEDPLRMLRAVQFAARFGYTLDEETWAALVEAVPLVASVSAERLRDELAKLIGLAPRPSVGFELMRESGLLAAVLPELAAGIGVEQNEWHRFDVYGHTLATVDATPPGDLVLRLAALFHDVAKPQTKDGPHFYRHELVGAETVREVLGRLRFPGEVVETAATLVRTHMYQADPAFSDAAVRRFVRRVGVEHLDRLFALRAADIVGSGLPERDDANARYQARVAQILAERPAFSVRDLAVDGADVIAALMEVGALPPGSRGGPAVGALLGELLESVTDAAVPNEREPLLREVARLAAHASGRLHLGGLGRSSAPPK